MKIATGAAILLVLAGIYWWLWESGALEALGDEQALRDQIQRLGIWGPLGIII
ncbi:MAG: TVP38/TMEM64 family protein, partial [Rhizobiales bacterium]|nr:TVP38/TMEM64 family protein [Hyphomicrobiales bacterium]